MTEQEIMQLIVEGGIGNPSITYDQLVQAYVRCLANLCGEIRQFEFIELVALTALLYKKSQAQAQASTFTHCPMCGK